MKIYSKKRFFIFISIVVFMFLSLFVGLSLLPKKNPNQKPTPTTGIKSQEISDSDITEKGILLNSTSNGTYESERTYESRIFKTGFEFNAIAPLWEEDVPTGTSLEIYVRAGKNSVWSNWTKVTSAAGTMGKDNSRVDSRKQFVEAPFSYVGNEVQYKILLKTTDPKTSPKLINIKFNYIDSRGNLINKLQSFFKNLKSNHIALGAALPPTQVISRSDWGCPEPTPDPNNPMADPNNPNHRPTWPVKKTPVKKFIVHHTGDLMTSASGVTSPIDPAAEVRAIWNYHKFAAEGGWGDIGYNYIVDQNGKVYEGRFGGEDVQGGHTRRYNAGSMGIAVLGNYEKDPKTNIEPPEPTTNILDSISKVIGYYSLRHSINPSGNGPLDGEFVEGLGNAPTAETKNIEGHKTYNPSKNKFWDGTACPGKIINYLDYIRGKSQEISGRFDNNSGPVINGPTCSLDDMDQCVYCDAHTKLQQRMDCLGMWGISFKERKKEGDLSRGQNRQNLITGINAYISEKYPGSPFLRINGGNPGALFVSVSEEDGGYNINPLILVAVSAVTTDMGSSSVSVMTDCGNPWKQGPSQQNEQSIVSKVAAINTPSCKDRSGTAWYEFNKKHEINEDMVYNQAERMKSTYVQDYTIRSLGGNRHADPPGDDIGFIARYNELNGDVLDEGEFIRVMNELIDFADKSLACKGDGAGGEGECTEAEVPDMSDIGISEESRQVMLRNCDAYKGAATEAGVPWQMLMALHYREGGGNPDQSLKNGYKPLCNGSDSACPTDICVPGDTLLNDARCAAKILKDKFNYAISNGKASGNPASPDDNLVRWAFSCYNGCGATPPEQRTYVMSRYPGFPDNDANPGTFTTYAKLMGRF